MSFLNPLKLFFHGNWGSWANAEPHISLLHSFARETNADDQAVQDDPEDEDFAVDGGGQSSGEEAEEDEASFRSDESESDDSEDEDFIAGGRARKRVRSLPAPSSN